MSTFLLLLKPMMRKKKYKLSSDIAPEMDSFKVFPSVECLNKEGGNLELPLDMRGLFF